MSEALNETLQPEIVTFSDDPEIETKLQTIIRDVDGIIEGFLQDHNIESIKDMTQQEYTGLLHYVSMVYFTPTKCLYEFLPGLSHDGQTVYKYNDNIIVGLVEYYINLCMIYNKVCNPFGFSIFAGIPDKTIARWENGESQRPEVYTAIKRLRSFYETSLENGAQSGKNPVGYIATLNHRFNWSSDPKTSIQVNITRDKGQIMQSVDTALLTENT